MQCLMADKFETRRQQFVALVDKITAKNGGGRGALAQISRVTHIDASYLSRMLYTPDKNGHKRIGEDVVEVLSQHYPGWNDEAPAAVTFEARQPSAPLRVEEASHGGAAAPPVALPAQAPSVVLSSWQIIMDLGALLAQLDPITRSALPGLFETLASDPGSANLVADRVKALVSVSRAAEDGLGGFQTNAGKDRLAQAGK